MLFGYHDAMTQKGNITLRKRNRFFFIIICLCVLVLGAADLVTGAYAASPMTASESCIEFIKTVEGFSPQPYYDYGQHTVGYGTKCPDDKYFDYMANGIPREEADVLLRETVAEVGNTIHQKLMEPYGLTFTQHQFDALVSFSFNLGTSWMTYDSSLRNAILQNADADELVDAFGLYCTAGGNYSAGLITRRLCEANIFLNGIYSPKASDAYGYVFYEPNGGSLTYQVQGYICENSHAPMADAVRSGDVFLGWYTDLTGGSQVSHLTKALSGKTLFARWQSSENAETENAPSTIITVTGDVVNIRKGPGTNYGISKQVCRNDVLIVSHTTQFLGQKWGKVQDGWICLAYTNYDALVLGQPSGEDTVPDQNPDSETDSDRYPDNQDIISGTVRVNDLLRIRSGPGTAYATVGYLSNGTGVEILEQKAADTMIWGRISRGWVSMDYIVTEDLPAGDTTEPDQRPAGPSGQPESAVTEGIIKADALRIRSGPGTVNPIVGFYYQNDIVVITERMFVDSVYWGKTDRGWIHMDYVRTGPLREESSPPVVGEVKTVIADCLRVRKNIGTDSRIAALLYYGDKVTVLETTAVDGVIWGRTDTGWICMDYVE